MPSVTLFAGPSAFGIDTSLLEGSGVRMRPPARRGDIDSLVAAAQEPGVIILCDGVFQTEPSVSHAELCRAIDGGWQMWGVSSIGAIRAFELRAEGMHGFGYVHSLFHRFADFTDDEMCLLHFPEEPFYPVSEALVNVRYALAQRRAALALSPASVKRVLAVLGNMWFGDRTTQRIRDLLLEQPGTEANRVDEWLAWLGENRIKTIDLARLLARRPWRGSEMARSRTSPGPAPRRPTSPRRSA